jgi:hypothetical protein
LGSEGQRIRDQRVRGTWDQRGRRLEDQGYEDQRIRGVKDQRIRGRMYGYINVRFEMFLFIDDEYNIHMYSTEMT